VTAVPRPKTKLSDDQQRLLDELVELASRARDLDQAVWDGALAARNEGIPDEMICDEAGLSRSTFYRKFGPRRREET
jgi:AraC-like DNA-binding protein